LAKEIEWRIEEKEEKKLSMLKNFNVSYLEEMLNSSTKSVAREVVSTLVSQGEPGVLQQLETKTDDHPEEEEEYVSQKQKVLDGFTQPNKSSWKTKAEVPKTAGEEELHLPPAERASGGERRQSGTRTSPFKSSSRAVKLSGPEFKTKQYGRGHTEKIYGSKVGNPYLQSQG